MKHVLIMNNSDISNAPRPRRMVEALKSNYKLTILTKEIKNNSKIFDNINFLFHSLGKESKFTKFYNVIKNLFGFYEKALWTSELVSLRKQLIKNDYDYIVCHNLSLLPLALSIKKNAKILFDAREYFPRHFEDRFIWKLMYQEFNKYLCYKYMPLSDYIITVSDGIMEEYKKDLGISNIEVIESLPDYYNLTPKNVDEKIKIIHHGNASPSRKIEEMIYMMDYVDSRYHLDLMLVNSNKKYYKQLENMIKQRDNVNLIEPVKYKEIIRTINKYDIGLYNAKPTSFNTKYMLPNKFFEFVQSRLAIVIGPSIEMNKYIEKYKLGKVSNSFDLKDLANCLNTLTKDEIILFKNNSDKASSELNHEINIKKIKKIIEEQ